MHLRERDGKRIDGSRQFHRGDAATVRSAGEFFEFELLACELQMIRLNELESLGSGTRLLFWVNSYNLVALHARIVFQSPCDASARGKYFTQLKYNIGGFLFSLDDILHGILRGAGAIS